MIAKKDLKQSVDPDLLRSVFEAVEELPANERDYDGHLFAVLRLLTERGIPVGKRAEIATAVSLRIEALARLTLSGGGRGWVSPGTEGCEFIHDDLVRCTAEEPLIEVDGHPTFDSTSFHRRLLALAEMHGTA